MSIHEVRAKLGDEEIIIETGKMAKQAGGAVTVRSGDSIVLVTATSSAKAREECDFLPLTVEYIEKTFAAGKIPGGFFKREGKPADSAVLTARFIDRPIRPLFPDHYYYETQVIATVLSASPNNPPETLAMIGASAALTISDIPFNGPIAGCRVSRVGGQFRINLSLAELEQSDLDLVVAASQGAVLMVEGEAREALEGDLVQAIAFAHEALKPVIAAQTELKQKCGKPKRTLPELERRDDISQAVRDSRDAVKQALAIRGKQDRYARLNEIKDAIKEKVLGGGEVAFANNLQLNDEFESLKSELMRADILKNGRRIDGRDTVTIRDISCEVGLLPRAHGSALFTRGETQALVVATLGTSEDEQIIDGLLQEKSKAFMLNYNFPPFSVGEVKPLRSPGRREIGHGHLAERALHRLLPPEEAFPYTIRIVSEILESNGSSSMATVCGGSLALMDAGVPIKAPVAGIAMGLIKEGDDFAILSDILGDEDHLGDMDFKVTGTEKGVTALQMDIKIAGITTAIMQKALDQAREGRLFILDRMKAALAHPREEMSKHAPKIREMRIPVEKIKDVIGPGGRHIKAIVEQTGAKIDIEDDGLVRIYSKDDDAMEMAVLRVKEFSGTPEIGKVYDGTVRRITNFGAFVEILPRTDGLVHISQISGEHIRRVEDVLSEGDRVRVKVLAVDEFGKIRLTMMGLEQPERERAKGRSERRPERRGGLRSDRRPHHGRRERRSEPGHERRAKA